MSEVTGDFESLLKRNIQTHQRFLEAATEIICAEGGTALPLNELVALSVEFAGQMSKAWTELIRSGVVQDIADSIKDLGDNIRCS